jgi:inner membrane protein
MPSPLAHGLAGLTVHVLASRDSRELRDPWRIGVTVGAALIPDADLLFKLVDGKNHHNDELHSLGFALLAAVCGAFIFRLLAWRRPIALAVCVAIGWGSHLLLDYLNVDTNPPIGLMALWPFSDAYYKSSIPIFLDIGRKLDWNTARHDAVAGAWELVVLVPLLFASWRYKARQLGDEAWHVGSRARR